MASRRDELRAHQFLKQRAVSALVIHQTDPEQPPFRRPMVAGFWGLGLALLGLTIAGVLSFFHSSSTLKLQNGKNVIISDTGATYVFLGNKLHETLNFTSAELALPQHESTQMVTEDQLVGIKRGATIGIPDAPDDPPSTAHLWKGAWNMCSTRVSNSSQTGFLYKSVLTIGSKSTPRKGLASGDGAELFQVNGHGPVYLVWQGYRHLLRNPSVVLGGVAPAATPMAVNSVFLESLPSGPDIGPIAVPGEGAHSTALANERSGVRRGQIYVATGADLTDQYYLVVGNKTRPITQLQADIQRATPGIKQAYAGGRARFIRLTSDEGARLAGNTSTAGPASAAPSVAKKIVNPIPGNISVCAAYPPGSAVPSLTVSPRIPPATDGTTVGGRGKNNLALVDRVVVDPGWGALVRVVGNQDKAVAGTAALVTDDGRLFPLASGSGTATTDVAGILGYRSAEPIRVTVSGALAGRLPRGPVLDPAQAKQPHE